MIDPASGLDATADVLIENGLITAINRHGDCQPQEGAEIIYANSCLVTPGLVDCHVHAYEYATPLGINIDDTCLGRGVTTVVDAGSAGIKFKSQ